MVARTCVAVLLLLTVTELAAAQCVNNKPLKKCLKKLRKGKCSKRNIFRKKCALTCGGCTGTPPPLLVSR